MKSAKTGLWLIGAYGDIATTLIVGTLAIRRGLAPPIGLVTETPPLNELKLLSLNDVVFGGHDIVESSVSESANKVCETSRTFSSGVLEPIRLDLEHINRDIVIDPKFGWETNQYESAQPIPSSFAREAQPKASLSELSLILRSHLKNFAATHSLAHIVVVNLASSESQTPIGDAHQELASFEKLIEADDKSQVSPSMLCAYAAFLESCSYINFTPNPGSSIGALQELANSKGLPHYGNDGKTGETLVKSALAPMFVMRNLRVMSWEGTNLLGNNDGKVLNNPENRKNKVMNKECVLPGILGYPVHSGVDINYVPSLGDWKTAWDFIHFQGFLNVPMTMQFTWQGCDSILAAPLVLDMVRLAEFAYRRGEGGLMKHLACFFKNPLGVREHALNRQFDMLLDYVEQRLT